MPRRLREQRGLTQGEVATLAKVTRFYISQLEAGLRESPSLPVLRRLHRALGVPLMALLE